MGILSWFCHVAARIRKFISTHINHILKPNYLDICYADICRHVDFLCFRGFHIYTSSAKVYPCNPYERAAEPMDTTNEDSDGQLGTRFTRIRVR